MLLFDYVNMQFVASPSSITLAGITSTAAEIDTLTGVVAGTAKASSAAVLGATKNLDILGLPVGGLKIGASGAEVVVTDTAAELNVLHSVTGGTLAASKAVVLGANASISDNNSVILGSVVATAATCKTSVYDAATNALGMSVNGSSAAPQVVKSTASGTVKVDETVTNLPAAASGVTDLISDYRKINVVGAGVAGATPVVSRKILNVGLTGGANNSLLGEGYIRQDTLTKGGTGTVSTLKGYAVEVNVGADNFTATNGIQGINVIMSGSATIGTGKVKGISIDINGTSKVDVALQIAGAPVEFIKLGDTGPSITAGAATTDSSIKTAMGITAPAGSIYISSNGTGEIWIMQTTTWTKLTIN